MQQQPSENLLKAIAVTSELTGTDLSKSAASVMAQDLAQYPEHQVMGALTKCRRELRGRMSVADVIARLDDGRPGPEEAWAMVYQALNDERVTMVVTPEMMLAFAAAWPLRDDPIAARMAFKEYYEKAIAQSRDRGVAVKWQASLGHDAVGREAPLLDAVEKGRLSVEQVRGLLPLRDGSDAQQRLEFLQREIDSRLVKQEVAA